MTRPPPKSPLFPHTTLFRSLSLVTASNSMTQQPQISEEQAPPSASLQSRASIIETWFEAHNDLAVATIVVAGFPLRLWIDRKSTRLNSSHSQISYAVFCLKK